MDRGSPLRKWPIECEALGRVWRIPALSAAEWIDAFLDGPEDLDGIFPGLAEPLIVDGQKLTIASELYNDEYVAERSIGCDTTEVARVALTQATGRKWWVACNLMAEATNWDGGAGGVLLLRGVDYDRLSIGALLACTYTLLQEVSGKDWQQNLFKLEKPPEGIDVAEMIDEDKASNAFMSAMSSNRRLALAIHLYAVGRSDTPHMSATARADPPGRPVSLAHWATCATVFQCDCGQIRDPDGLGWASMR